MEGRVLLIDDDPTVLRVATHHLEENGIRCIVASDGNEARQKVEDQFPMAVVLDLGLPDVEGKDLLKQFRRDYPDLPVVVLTAEDDINEVVECMKIGAMDYVHKSYEWTRLVASVRNACRHGRLQRRLISLSDE
ncbi:MAG: response regulator, partial [Planctomycetota bacterium]